MAFSYRWTIDAVSGFPKKNNLEKVVSSASWTLEVRQIEDGSLHWKRGVTNFPDPTSENFTDYLELSPEEILEWVWSLEGGKENLEESTKQELITMLAPPESIETVFEMPWTADCCPDTSPEEGLQGFRSDGIIPGTVVQDIR